MFLGRIVDGSLLEDILISPTETAKSLDEDIHLGTLELDEVLGQVGLVLDLVDSWEVLKMGDWSFFWTVKRSAWGN